MSANSWLDAFPPVEVGQPVIIVQTWGTKNETRGVVTKVSRVYATARVDGKYPADYEFDKGTCAARPERNRVTTSFYVYTLDRYAAKEKRDQLLDRLRELTRHNWPSELDNDTLAAIVDLIEAAQARNG